MNEIQIMRSLDHPNVLKLHEVHETANTLYLVLDLLEGGELLERLTLRRSYSEYDCIMVLKRIFETLAYMHSKGIMHRDIKLENIILTSKQDDYDLKLVDFGLSCYVKTKVAIHKRCGTPGFCAPEVLNYKDEHCLYSEKCDVFSVGCIFYQLYR